MQKKLLFMLINLNVGGTEKALLNMLQMLPKDYQTTLLVLEEKGGFINHLPANIHLKVINEGVALKRLLNQSPYHAARALLKQGAALKAIALLFFYLFSKLFNVRMLYYWYLLRKEAPLKEHYDLAVAYAGPMDFISYFIVKKVKAGKKVQWIHFDIRKIGFDVQLAAQLYQYFDKIYIVSNEAKQHFDEHLPRFKAKTEVFHNVIAKEEIQRLAREAQGFSDPFDGLRILTVGRLSKEKGQDLALETFIKLKDEGYNIHWYCIGEGPLRTELEAVIHKHHLEEQFILLGEQTNPYPFMKGCDLYVQPSRHEGYCMTLAEARCLCRPIVVTAFAGAYEQLLDAYDGWIAQNTEDLYRKIKHLIELPKERDRLVNTLIKEQMSMKKEHDRVVQIIEESI
ncbi:glycosyl transferase [Pullulanibacillus camelliae]|uniref:Glycosyl transferase n=1 Tax=Pullulanibacillus camelliae TaxID=1707096 RepID=A0A8J2VND6_9BACL|nr:glycosyltransferase [Pullulanibacillus camelliae]GGE30543.1 glycosyl transferase [Pullulanibacillus camelliae]